jgi:geranylgeranyl diphosphate synthase type 3
VNKKRYFVRKFVLQLCITFHCRFDDIQDNSLLRRSVPAAHRVYGIANTISAAMFVNFMSLQKALSTNQHEMIKLYADMMLEAWRGQAIEIYWRENHTCPLEEEYLEMVKKSNDSDRTMSRI